MSTKTARHCNWLKIIDTDLWGLSGFYECEGCIVFLEKGGCGYYEEYGILSDGLCVIYPKTLVTARENNMLFARKII